MKHLNKISFGKPTAKDFVVKTSFTGESTFNDIVSKYIPLAKKETVEITKAIKLSMMDKEEFVDNDCYTHEVCGYLFDFCKKHIKYKLDTEGLEEIRLPRKTWADRATGVDCEDFVIFLSGILQNLNISHTIKMVDFGDGWQHIYIMVGKYVLDPVQDTFDYESPYKRKKEYFVRVKESAKVLPLGQVMVKKDVLDDILSQAVSLSSLEKKKVSKKNTINKNKLLALYYKYKAAAQMQELELLLIGKNKSVFPLKLDVIYKTRNGDKVEIYDFNPKSNEPFSGRLITPQGKYIRLVSFTDKGKYIDGKETKFDIVDFYDE